MTYAALLTTTQVNVAQCQSSRRSSPSRMGRWVAALSARRAAASENTSWPSASRSMSPAVPHNCHAAQRPHGGAFERHCPGVGMSAMQGTQGNGGRRGAYVRQQPRLLVPQPSRLSANTAAAAHQLPCICWVQRSSTRGCSPMCPASRAMQVRAAQRTQACRLGCKHSPQRRHAACQGHSYFTCLTQS